MFMASKDSFQLELGPLVSLVSDGRCSGFICQVGRNVGILLCRCHWGVAILPGWDARECRAEERSKLLVVVLSRFFGMLACLSLVVWYWSLCCKSRFVLGA